MKKPKFKVGDFVTYKDALTLRDRRYYYAGINYKGEQGKIVEYLEYIDTEDCFKVYVTIPNSLKNYYAMLEKEFEEWDKVPKGEEKIPSLKKVKKSKKTPYFT